MVNHFNLTYKYFNTIVKTNSAVVNMINSPTRANRSEVTTIEQFQITSTGLSTSLRGVLLIFHLNKMLR